MSQKLYEESNIQAIADAIRAQNGSTDTYLPSEMSTAIEELSVLDTSDATATAGDMASGVTAYVNGEKITGNIPIPSSMLSSLGYIKSSSIGVGSEAIDAMIEFMVNEKIILSSVRTYFINFNKTLLGDATASDVISGKTFTSTAGLKITGTYTPPETLDTSDATATESDIVSGQTAYVNGTKLTGTLVLQNYYTGTTTPESTTGDDGDLYFKVTN